MKMDIAKWKEKAGKLRLETYALYLAARRKDVPWYAKAIIVLTVAYAVSPIDLIPDFIPVLGYLDDLVLVPLGIALALKLIPGHIMEQCRNEAANTVHFHKPYSKAGAVFVATVWLAAAVWLGLILYKMIK